MRNLRLCIAYDGSQFLGWQETKNGPSVEGALRIALERLLQHRVCLQAASRTDAGVHASGQIVNLLTPNTFFTCPRLMQALNGTLPREIVVYTLDEAPLEFHPTTDNLGKEYHYHVCASRIQLPQRRHYSWQIYEPLNRDLIHQAIRLLTGEHDFKAFCNWRKQLHYTNYVRKVRRFELIVSNDDQIRFELVGAHFLYKMVRNLVGTVMDIGRGRLLLADLPAIIASGDRTRAGVTAPAHGLELHRVFF